jgi:thiamine-phosphate pyrophosphorylase
MRLVVISPEFDEPHEHAVLAELFAAGLGRYHVRKPQWSREKLAAWLHAIPRASRPRIVLHQYHELATEFGLGGVHFKDASAEPESALVQWAGFTSRSCHDLATLSGSLGHYAAVFLSPVFPSISKQGYRPKMALASIAEQLADRTDEERKTEVIALGGVTPANAASCAELGFDGVAVLGAIWRAEQPLKIFEQLQQSITTYAARTS